MKVNLSVTESTCIRCGKCVRVCPSWIFRQEAAGAAITLDHPENCIVCGHCAAVCPTGSVVHGSFPPDKVHPIDRALLPTPEQVMLLCKARRSNRAFSSRPIPAEALDMILEAAHRAPTASNKQEVAFTLITDPEKLRAVSRYTIDVFASVAKKLENPVLRPLLRKILPDAYRYLPAFHRLTREYAAGNDLILRKATAVIFIHTPRSNRFGAADANLAYQNGSLMAESLGVSQFYTGFVCSAVKQDKRKELNRLLNIEGTIHAGMALGLPSFLYPSYIDKEAIEVQRW